MVMRVDYLDTVFENSRREEELIIGFDIPYIKRSPLRGLDPDKKAAAIRAHQEFFDRHGVTFKLFGPFLNSGFIVGGLLYWADCGDREDILQAYSDEFEMLDEDGVNYSSRDPSSYRAFLYPVASWRDKNKPEWDRYRALGPDAYFEQRGEW